MWNHTLYYTLSEAYWRTGAAIFKDEWTGFETRYGPDKDLKVIRNELLKSKRTFDRKADQIRNAYNSSINDMDDQEYRRFQRYLKTLEQEQQIAREERDRLSDILRVPEIDAAAYERRVVSECRLIDAFKKKELQLLFDYGSIVDWDNWSKDKAFKVHFGLSLIYPPTTQSSMRRGGAYISKSALNNWLENTLIIELSLIKKEGFEEFQEMQNWFKEWIAQDIERKTKDETERAFNAIFEPKAKGTFLKLWKMMVPAQWQERGRIRV